MKWRTHRALTRMVLRRLGLGGDVIEACLEGVVEPDKRIEYSLAITPRGRVRLVRKPHHSFWRASDAIHYIYKARQCFLKGRLDMAGYYLGQALHYIQDRCVEKPILADHGEVEAEAGELGIPGDAIERGIMDSISHPKRVEGLVWTMAGSTSPGRALWHAAYYTAWVAKAVFTISGVEEARRQLQGLNKWAKRLGLGLAILAPITLLACALGLMAAVMMLAILDAAILSIIIYLLNEGMKLRRWFGI